MSPNLPPIESRVAFPVATTEARLAAILDKVTAALTEHLKRRVQMGRAPSDDGAVEFAIWIPGDSFTGVLVSLDNQGTSARLRERAVSSQADQVLHTALGMHLSSLDGSKISVGSRGEVPSSEYERALEEQWNERWLEFVKTARRTKKDLVVTAVDGEIVLPKSEVGSLPKDDVKAFQKLYEAVDAEVKRRNR
jgi:hypothetical protein